MLDRLLCCVCVDSIAVTAVVVGVYDTVMMCVSYVAGIRCSVFVIACSVGVRNGGVGDVALRMM